VSNYLKEAQVELIICSEDSVKRPWINFEAGAGWVKGIPVIPVCHTGMRPVDLPIPLNMLQAVEAAQEAGLRKIYSLLANKLGSATPSADFSKVITEIQKFEQEYGVVRVVKSAVKSLIKLLPELEQIFKAAPVHKIAQGDVLDLVLDKMRPHLDLLQARRMIDFATGPNKLVLGAIGGGNVIELKIQVHDAYYRIAQQVMT
jgi:hypothetical protein